MLEVDPTLSQGIHIHQIRRPRDSVDLRKQIFDDLLSKPLQMPPLLLWNDEGQRLFDKLSETPSYYLTTKELEILAHDADAIIGSMPDHSAIIELGCGSLQKTSIILSAFERQQRAVTYYALDVSISEMTRNLKKLAERFAKTRFVKIQGLSGTYEDCVGWLATSPTAGMLKSVNFLWVGNSIANSSRPMASSLLSHFARVCTTLGIRYQFIVGADACNQVSKIIAAYDPASKPFKDFILNGLHHANTVIGQDMFHVSDWACAIEFNPLAHVLQISYTPNRDVRLEINGCSVTIRKGEKVSATTSGKWTEEDMEAVAAEAGLQITDTWRDFSNTYCFYKIQPREYSAVRK